MFAANLRAILVDSTAAIVLEVQATIVDEQVPAILVLVNLGVGVGDLLQQHVEVFRRPGGMSLMGQIGTAGRALAEATLVVGGDPDLLRSFDRNQCGHGLGQ